MTAKELLHLIPQAFQAGDPSERATVQYDISEPVYHVIGDGKVEAFDGRAEAPDVTIRVSDDNLIKLMRGQLNPMTAFMTGKLKIDGNVMLAQKLVARVDRQRLEELV